MISVLHHKIDNLLPSVEGSKRIIEHILTMGVKTESIESALQLTHGTGYQYNHRGTYTDIDMETKIGITPVKATKRQKRKLSAKNRKKANQYIKELTKLLDPHDVFRIFDTLNTSIIHNQIKR